MTRLKSVALGIGVLALCVSVGCGGGGGGGGVAGATGGSTSYKMTDVTPPPNAGQEGGFIYASYQTVSVTVTAPGADEPVSVYLEPVLSASPYKTTTPATPVLLAHGKTGSDNKYHDTLTLPASVKNIFIVPMPGRDPGSATVAITDGKAEVTFAEVQ